MSAVETFSNDNHGVGVFDKDLKAQMASTDNVLLSSTTMSTSTTTTKTGHKRGRKLNDSLPPSRSREIQRAFRARKAQHLNFLETKVQRLEAENLKLRQAFGLTDALDYNNFLQYGTSHLNFAANGQALMTRDGTQGGPSFAQQNNRSPILNRNMDFQQQLHHPRGQANVADIPGSIPHHPLTNTPGNSDAFPAELVGGGYDHQYFLSQGRPIPVSKCQQPQQPQHRQQLQGSQAQSEISRSQRPQSDRLNSAPSLGKDGIPNSLDPSMNGGRTDHNLLDRFNVNVQGNYPGGFLQRSPPSNPQQPMQNLFAQSSGDNQLPTIDHRLGPNFGTDRVSPSAHSRLSSLVSRGFTNSGEAPPPLTASSATSSESVVTMRSPPSTSFSPVDNIDSRYEANYEKSYMGGAISCAGVKGGPHVPDLQSTTFPRNDYDGYTRYTRPQDMIYPDVVADHQIFDDGLYSQSPMSSVGHT